MCSGCSHAHIWAPWMRAVGGTSCHALVDQEFEVGMRVLTVPLYGRSGRLQASLSLTTHASRVSIEEMRLRYLLPLYEAQALLKPVLD